MEQASPSLPAHPLRFALRVSRPHARWAYAAVVAVTAAQGIGTAMPLILKDFTNAATSIAQGAHADGTALWWLAAVYALLFFVVEMCWRASGYCGMKWFTQMEATAADKLFAYLLGHSADYFNDRFAGALTNKVNNAVQGSFEMLRRCLWQFLPITIAFGVGVVIAFTANVWLGTILGVYSLIFVAINWQLVKRKQRVAIEEAESSSVLKGVMVDTATNITAVHQSGHTEHELEHVRGYIEEKKRRTVRNWIASELILGWSSVMQSILVAVLFLTSVFLFLRGDITLGDVILIVSLSLQITSSMILIGNEMMYFMNDFGQVQEGLAELLLPQDITDKPGASALAAKDASVRFDHVGFRYGRGGDVFKDFSLKIESGQKVGLVGISGAGKTTLTSLLLRQYDVTDGRILIGGHDVRESTLETLRKAIAVVPQDITLFHRSIRENIRYGRLGATDADVERAATLAYADAFIRGLPAGYDTLVGERGIKLSGGQRQRIAVARAILKDSPILILDEATSALDSESETLIQDALKNLIEGKTVLAIAHRLSTLRAMDRIIVLERGKVTEDGTHDELLALDGHYASLWKSQVKGFIQE